MFIYIVMFMFLYMCEFIVGNKLMVYDGIYTEDLPYTGVCLPVVQSFSVFHVSDWALVVDSPIKYKIKIFRNHSIGIGLLTPFFGLLTKASTRSLTLLTVTNVWCINLFFSKFRSFSEIMSCVHFINKKVAIFRFFFFNYFLEQTFSMLFIRSAKLSLSTSFSKSLASNAVPVSSLPNDESIFLQLCRSECKINPKRHVQ